MLRRSVLIVAILLAGARGLAGQVPIEERIPVRDPKRLEAMGFSADATNVYVWSRAEVGAARAKDAALPEAPETWGTALGYTNIFGHELTQSFDTYNLDRTLTETHCEWANDDGFAYTFARFPVPDGAALKQFKFWAHDSSDALDLDFAIYEQCEADGPDPGFFTLIAETFTILAIGDYFGFTSLHDFPVNNRLCGYTVRVRFKEPGQVCEPLALQLQKMQVSWYRRVSPAPAVASFDDVPASHPFFQFVEALVKSGVTGGCGGGSYCPDAPLTRGQMAVFLSKALGLQWP